MQVPITQFRQRIFALVEQALNGEEVWVSHKGRRVRIVPENAASKLSRITPMEIVNHDEGGLEHTGLMEEMTRAWEADWDRDFGPAPGAPPVLKPTSRRKRVKP